MALPNRNRLLVEGDEDMRVIPYLIEENGIPWKTGPRETIVEIKTCDGIDKMLKPRSISTELKARNLQRLGLLVDADQDLDRCWQRIRNACARHFPTLPEAPLPEGTVVQNDDGQWLGIWLMPDNRSHGMLETFLASLVPGEHAALWQHAEKATSAARQVGAPFKDTHGDKACIHAWLAWQDPPGRQLHAALIQHILDPKSPHAGPFVAWFRRLYAV